MQNRPGGKDEGELADLIAASMTDMSRAICFVGKPVAASERNMADCFAAATRTVSMSAMAASAFAPTSPT